MPTYQVTYEAEDVMTVRNYFALSTMKVIDKVIDQEAEEWTGETVSLEIKQVGNK